MPLQPTIYGLVHTTTNGWDSDPQLLDNFISNPATPVAPHIVLPPSLPYTYTFTQFSSNIAATSACVAALTTYRAPVIAAIFDAAHWIVVRGYDMSIGGVSFIYANDPQLVASGGGTVLGINAHISVSQWLQMLDASPAHFTSGTNPYASKYITVLPTAKTPTKLNTMMVAAPQATDIAESMSSAAPEKPQPRDYIELPAPKTNLWRLPRKVGRIAWDTPVFRKVETIAPDAAIREANFSLRVIPSERWQEAIAGREDGVKPLVPGLPLPLLVIDPSTFRVTRYYLVPFGYDDGDKTLTRIVVRIRAELTLSVRNARQRTLRVAGLLTEESVKEVIEYPPRYADAILIDSPGTTIYADFARKYEDDIRAQSLNIVWRPSRQSWLPHLPFLVEPASDKEYVRFLPLDQYTEVRLDGLEEGAGA